VGGFVKTTKEVDEGSKKFAKQLKEHFSDEELASFILTLLGMSDLAHTFIWKKVQDFMELPVQVKYSVVTHARFCVFLSSVARGEFKSDEHELSHMPTHKGSWESDDDFEQRFIFVVKSYYEQLKEAGKV
jgi:hypothetical protein